MANTQAHPVNGHAGGKSSDGKNQRPSQLDITLPAMDALSEELNRLAAINTELVGRLRGAAAFQPKRSVDGAASTEVEALQQENAELRGRVRQSLEGAGAAHQFTKNCPHRSFVQRSFIGSDYILQNLFLASRGEHFASVLRFNPAGFCS